MRQSGQPDYVLLGLVGLLTIFGLIMLSSASSVVAFEKWGDSFYSIKHQLLYGVLPGIIFFIIGLKVPYTLWKKMALPFLAGTLLLLILTLIPGIGTSLGGSKSWLIWHSFSVQPSEIAKIAMIFYLAAWFSVREQTIKDVFYGLIPFLCLVGAIALLIVLQPDIGTLFIVVVIAMVMYFLAGAPWRYIIFLILVGFVSLFLLIKIAPYRTARLMTFVHPELDPKGIGYQINQSLLGIGSGGVFGLGYGQSRQKFRYLPEVSGDSIFAVIAEELGFVISATFIIILFLFFRRILKIANRSPDSFARFTILGIGSWFIIQAFLNISSIVGLLPLTGLPLPFISYGGTALIVSLFAVGVVGNISKYTNK